MSSSINLRKIKESVKRKEASFQNKESILSSSFQAQDNFKSEYDMWSWIFQEIATIRLEVSRLGSLVRINNPISPNYLEPYHSQIYALLIPATPAITDKGWKQIDGKWLATKKEIEAYFVARKVAPNKKIPFELVRNLDSLYRVAILLLQEAGLGFRMSAAPDSVEKALESAIAGD